MIFDLFIEEKPYFLSIISGLLITISIISFVAVSCLSPGYINSKETNIIKLIDIYRTDFICPYCEVIRSYEAHHCHLCKKCIRVKII